MILSIPGPMQCRQWFRKPIAGTLALLIAAVMLQCACGGVSSGGTGGTNSAGGVPQFAHVFLVVEENHSFNQVIGNSNMAYLNSLANANGLATQYFADAHPSLPDYFELTVGEGSSITGLDGDSYSGVVTQDNVVRALTAAGKTWKCYAEALPVDGYLGGDGGGYVKRHDPFAYLSDVQNSSSQASNIVQFTQLSADMASSSLPQYGFIVPDINNDAHDCPPFMSTCTDDQKLANADQWLSAQIGPLLASPAFQNSLLIILFDEGDILDLQNFGGQVAAVLVSPQAKSGYQSKTFYQHASTLRLMLKGLGITDLPGAAASAADMSEFFK
jgi:phosphatidylinositol-3-phosphatase